MRQPAHRRPRLLSLRILLPLAVAGGCGAGDKTIDRMPAAAGDSARRPAASASAGAMAGMAGTTGDADHDFLRMMSDHHKGLIVLAHMTKERTDAGSAKADAALLDAEQDREIDIMQTMLEKDFKDPYTPKVAPEHRAMADGLKGTQGPAYASAFYRDVIAHHRQALEMIDAYLPKARSAAIRAMAEKMKMVQAKEIADYERKVARMK